jgi:diguanylate cyclase (GGDEF)-like protein
MSHRSKQTDLPPIKTRRREIVGCPRHSEKRNWGGATIIFVLLLMTLAGTSSALPSFIERAGTLFKSTLGEVVLGLAALANLYIIYQQGLIKRLQRQLAEKQDHSQILRDLAMVDALTGLYNRRFAEQRLAAEVARSARKGHPLTVVALDLNHFKDINDTYGHPAGDLVLQEFGANLKNAVRSGDLAVRMGGDEFLLILPECNLQQLQLVLGRLAPLEVGWKGQKIPIKWSAGWKEYVSGDLPEGLLAAADQALYENKRASKRSTLLVR